MSLLNTLQRALSAQWPLCVYVLLLLLLVVNLHGQGWEAGWKQVFVLPKQPMFFDMRTIPAGMLAVQQGLNPQQANPDDPRGRLMDYPHVWLWIGNVFHLDDETSYRHFCLAMVTLAVLVNMVLLYRWPSPWLLAAVLSPASLLAIERGNNDLLVYTLVVLFALAGKRIIAVLPLLVATALKIFPLFAVGALLLRHQWRLLALMLFLVLVLLWQMSGELSSLHAGIRLGWGLSYGLPNMAAILASGNSMLLYFMLMAALLVAAVLVVSNWCRARAGQFMTDDSIACSLFLAGACIYTGTFVFASNWDYRLIFLIPCIPWLVQPVPGKQRRPRQTLLVLVLASMSYRLLATVAGDVGIVINLLAKLSLFVLLVVVLLSMLQDSLSQIRSSRKGAAC